MAKYKIIEKVAGEMAAIFYEAGRSSGMNSKYKIARAYARANLEKFIPTAINHLLTVMHNPSTPKIMKDEIMEAYLERANAPGLEILNEPVPQFKLPENWKPIINSKGSKRIQ